MEKHPTNRFSNRVANYVKYRPNYPRDVVEELQTELNLSPDTVVADIGSGTGKFTLLLLEKGYGVYGVEPNKEMREAGENYLGAFPKFKSIAGQAEATILPDNSINLITAAQAFHWFDLDQTKPELERILKPSGHLAFIWNERDIKGSAFHQAYDKSLLKFCPEYQQTNHRNMGSKEIGLFIKDNVHYTSSFTQYFDYPSLEGRLFSSSYSPAPDHPDSIPLKKDLKVLFARYKTDNKVEFKYHTHLYYGKSHDIN